MVGEIMKEKCIRTRSWYIENDHWVYSRYYNKKEVVKNFIRLKPTNEVLRIRSCATSAALYPFFAGAFEDGAGI